MPELPEVETIVRGLRDRILHLEFSGVEVCLDKCLRGPRRTLSEWIQGKRICGVERRGKHIILSLGAGGALFVHLGMTGRLRVVPSGSPREKHTHLVFSFRNHPHQLRYVDSRRFGRVFWEKTKKGRVDLPLPVGPRAPGNLSIRIRKPRAVQAPGDQAPSSGPAFSGGSGKHLRR